MAASSRYWEGLDRTLSANYSVISLDLLGFGKSPQSTSGYTPESHVSAIYDTLRSLAIEMPVTIIAHSMGALIALNYAVQHPNMVARIILVGMPLYTSPEEARQDITGGKKRLKLAYYGPTSHILCTTWCYFLRPMTRRLARFYLRGKPSHIAEDSVLHTWKSYSQSMQHVIENQHVQELLNQLEIPLTLLYGNKDSPVVLKNAKALKLKTNVELNIVNGTHNLPLEYPETIVAILQKASP